MKQPPKPSSKASKRSASNPPRSEDAEQSKDLPPKSKQSSNDETKTEDEEIEARSTPEFWLQWIKDAQKGAPLRHKRQAQDAYAEYEKSSDWDVDSGSAATIGDRARVYPAYKTAVDTLEPALYSRTPDLVTERRFEIKDPSADVMSLIVERAGTYLMHRSNFDDVMGMVTADYIHAGKATNQVILDAEFEEGDVRVSLTIGDDGKYFDDSKVEFTDEILSDDGGASFYGMRKGKVPKRGTKHIRLAPATYDEILHTKNAKIQADITEMAYYFCCSEMEALETLDKEALKSYSWKSSAGNTQDPAEKNKGSISSSTTGQRYMDGWEVWCKQTKKLYFVSEGCPGKFLKKPETDPLGFEGFFPSPAFIIKGKPSKNMFPTPDWVHVRPTCDQLNLMYHRLFRMLDGAKRKALVAGDEDVTALLNSINDLEFITAKNIQNIVEKGGIQNLVQYLPIEPLMAAIAGINQQEVIMSALVEKWMGVPDVMQGLSDPIETLGAQEIKSQSAHDRFKNSKKKLQTIARDNIEMMLDLFFKVYEDDEIQEIVGFGFMTPQQQQDFPLALGVLRNDKTRLIRIGIDTDSLTFVNQGLKTQQVNATVTTITNGLKEAADMLQIDPSYATVAMQAILLSLDQSDVGMKFKEPVREAVQALIDAAEKAKQNPPPPPPPDPAIMKLEWEKQKAFEIDVPLKQEEMRLKDLQAQRDHEYRMAQLQVNNTKVIGEQHLWDKEINTKADETMYDINQRAQEHNDDALLKSREIGIDEGVAVNEAQTSQFELGLKAENSALEKADFVSNREVENAKLELQATDRVLDHEEAKRRTDEKLIEENRLAKDQAIKVADVISRKVTTDDKSRR